MSYSDSVSHQLAKLRAEAKLPRSRRPGRKTIKDIIAEYLVKFGPATADLVANLLGLNLVTTRARFTELHNDGLIHHTGKRYTDARRLQWMFKV